MGIRYRINVKTLLGCPDLSLKKFKIVIFIDGEFWHGFNWDAKKPKIKSNRNYWINKMEKNMQRYNKINTYYLDHGWQLFRFWEKYLIYNLEKCVDSIIGSINKVN